MIKYTVQQSDDKDSQYKGQVNDIYADSYQDLTEILNNRGWLSWLNLGSVENCYLFKVEEGGILL